MTDELKSYVWRIAATVPDTAYPPNAFRVDHRGRIISWQAYGNPSHPQGWVVGHIQAVSSDADDSKWNCRAEHFLTSTELDTTRQRAQAYPLFAPSSSPSRSPSPFASPSPPGSPAGAPSSSGSPAQTP